MFILLLVIKMTKEELKNELQELYNSLDQWWIHREDAIRQGIDFLIDYGNDSQDRSLDHYTHTFENADILEDYVSYRLKTFWPSQIWRDFRNVDSDDEYYKIDDVDWEVMTICEFDVLEWLQDIIDELKFYI